MEETQPVFIDLTEAFTTDQIFESREAVVSWAREVGRQNRVTVIITRSDVETGKRGRKSKLIFGCDRGGKYKSNKNNTGTSTKRCGCPFKLRSRPLKNVEGWIISLTCGLHNHELVDTFENNAFMGRLKEEDKKHVDELTKYHVAPRHILSSLRDRDTNNVANIYQIYKRRSTYMKNLKGPIIDMQHLLKLLEVEKYTCWSRTHGDSNVVKDMFWTHPDFITLLNMFPLVLIMDSTYKTNKYRLPLFEIVGVTSTGLTFNVAFAYMDSERQDNFCWALEKLKELFVSNTSFPQVIVTDRKLALMNAIEIVFPSSTNLLCQLHINKNVGAKCKQYILKKDMQEPILELWRKIVYCSEEKEYEELLQMFEQTCVDNIIFFYYVRDTWLNPYKERFVEAWTNRVLHLGNTTTNRIKSAHWSLNKFLEHNKGDFCKAWNDMNDMLKFQIIKIKGSFEISKGRKEHIHNNPFYGKLIWVVSKKALADIVHEYNRVSYVGNDKGACCCILRNTHGLPCACELARYKLEGVSIPLDVVHIHWRKLTMDSDQEEEKLANDLELDITSEMNKIWKIWKTLNVVGRRALKSKLHEIAYPETISMCAPLDKIKTKCGVKRKKGNRPKEFDVYHDPSYFEHVDTQVSQQASKQHSQQAPMTSQVRKYFDDFPPLIHPYIEDIVNVKADGNCGYRVIAALLGHSEEYWSIVRQQLYAEIKSKPDLYGVLFKEHLQEVTDSLLVTELENQANEKWMSIPDMGYVIATKYNLVLVTLGKTFCLTFFPLRGAHNGDLSRDRVISIGFVNESHWVQVKLKSACPLPPLAWHWKKHRSDESTSWAIAYTRRLQHWGSLDLENISDYMSLADD